MVHECGLRETVPDLSSPWVSKRAGPSDSMRTTVRSSHSFCSDCPRNALLGVLSIRAQCGMQGSVSKQAGRQCGPGNPPPGPPAAWAMQTLATDQEELSDHSGGSTAHIVAHMNTSSILGRFVTRVCGSSWGQGMLTALRDPQPQGAPRASSIPTPTWLSPCCSKCSPFLCLWRP